MPFFPTFLRFRHAESINIQSYTLAFKSKLFCLSNVALYIPDTFLANTFGAVIEFQTPDLSEMRNNYHYTTVTTETSLVRVIIPTATVHLHNSDLIQVRENVVMRLSHGATLQAHTVTALTCKQAFHRSD